MTSIIESTKNNREGEVGCYSYRATVDEKKSQRNIFGGYISELFVVTHRGHKFTFRNGRIFLNKLDLPTLTNIVKIIENGK